MRAFRFRLGRVLRVRRLQEEVARGELLAARALARTAREALEQADAQLARGRLELLDRLGAARLAPADVLLRHDAQDGLRQVRRARQERAVERERESEARRTRALAARAAVRGLERLEQRRREAHLGERERAERAAQDEVAQRRAAGPLPGRGSSPGPRPSDDPPQPPRLPAGAVPGPSGPRPHSPR